MKLLTLFLVIFGFSTSCSNASNFKDPLNEQKLDRGSLSTCNSLTSLPDSGSRDFIKYQFTKDFLAKQINVFLDFGPDLKIVNLEELLDILNPAHDYENCHNFLQKIGKEIIYDLFFKEGKTNFSNEENQNKKIFLNRICEILNKYVFLDCSDFNYKTLEFFTGYDFRDPKSDIFDVLCGASDSPPYLKEEYSQHPIASLVSYFVEKASGNNIAI